MQVDKLGCIKLPLRKGNKMNIIKHKIITQQFFYKGGKN